MPPPAQNPEMRDSCREAYAFFALVFLLSLPFWLLGAVADRQLMPGLPLSSLMIVCPVLAAFILRWQSLGSRQAVAFLKRAVDIHRLRPVILIVPILLINPAMFAVSYVLQRAAGVDMPLPDIQLDTILILFLVFLIAAIAEELGWMGHALEPLQRR